MLQACSKDTEHPCQFEVQCGNCTATYILPDGTTGDTAISGSWRMDFTGSKGDFVFLRAIDLSGDTMGVIIRENAGTVEHDVSFPPDDVAEVSRDLQRQ